MYRSELLQKYGGEEHLEAPPSELLLGQSEKYVEYTRDGKLLSGGVGAPPATPQQANGLA